MAIEKDIMHCTICPISCDWKWVTSLDNKGISGAILIDLSKAFDPTNHELLIAKLGVYGFGKSALAITLNYLSDCWQRIKINTLYEDKCHFLVLGKLNEHIFAKVGDELIWGSAEEKLLGVTIDKNINFYSHLSILCKKVGQKVTAPAFHKNDYY